MHYIELEISTEQETRLKDKSCQKTYKYLIAFVTLFFISVKAKLIISQLKCLSVTADG